MRKAVISLVVYQFISLSCLVASSREVFHYFPLNIGDDDDDDDEDDDNDDDDDDELFLWYGWPTKGV